MAMSLQDKLKKRILSPTEIVYDMIRHWFVVLTGLLLGTFVMMGKLSLEPTLFQATATLALSPNEVNLDRDAIRDRMELSRKTFVEDQLVLITSDSVLDKVVTSMTYDAILAQEDPQKSLEDLNLLGRAYYRARRYIGGLLSTMSHGAVGSLADQQRQRARSALRRRSSAKPEGPPLTSNIIRLTVQGTRRGQLEEELEAWIRAYKLRIEELSGETHETLFRARIEHWQTQEKEAKQVLDKFKAEHPEVSTGQLEWARENLLRQKMLLGDYQRQLAVPGAAPAVGSAAAADPLLGRETLLDTMKKQKLEMEAELRLLKVKWPPTSDRVKQHEKMIQDFAEDIARLDKPAPDGKPREEGLDREDILDRRIAQARLELSSMLLSLSSLEDKMAEMSTHVEQHRRAMEMRTKYQDALDRKGEQILARKTVDIQVYDRPWASVQPLDKQYFKFLPLGALVGAVTGTVLAFLMEFLNRRIRCKKDVEQEIGLPVVGVVPENRRLLLL